MHDHLRRFHLISAHQYPKDFQFHRKPKHAKKSKKAKPYKEQQSTITTMETELQHDIADASSQGQQSVDTSDMKPIKTIHFGKQRGAKTFHTRQRHIQAARMAPAGVRPIQVLQQQQQQQQQPSILTTSMIPPQLLRKKQQTAMQL